MIDLLVNALATDRVTRFVVEDKITEGLRYRIIGQFPDSNLSYLVTCPVCASVWAGLAVTVVKRSRIGKGLIYALALSQATIYMRELQDG